MATRHDANDTGKRRQRGLTLLELAIVVAIATLSFTALIEAHRGRTFRVRPRRRSLAARQHSRPQRRRRRRLRGMTTVSQRSRQRGVAALFVSVMLCFASIRRRLRASAMRERPFAPSSRAACGSSMSPSMRTPARPARPRRATAAIASSPGIASSRHAPTVAGRGGSSSPAKAGRSAARARRAASVATSVQAPARSMRTSRLVATTSTSALP